MGPRSLPKPGARLMGQPHDSGALGKNVVVHKQNDPWAGCLKFRDTVLSVQKATVLLFFSP